MSKIEPQVNHELILQTLRELASEQRLLVVGSYHTILDKLNVLRVARGYAPITLQALRTASFRRAVHDLNGAVLSGRGPVVIPITADLAERLDADLTVERYMEDCCDPRRDQLGEPG
jgi:hypothetical protein